MSGRASSMTPARGLPVALAVALGGHVSASAMAADVSRDVEDFSSQCSGHAACWDCLSDFHPATNRSLCRWCPHDKSCHDFDSLFDHCSVPINSPGQCWGQSCPNQIGGFSSIREDDRLKWAETTVKAVLVPIHPFPKLQPGDTALFDLATARPLDDASQGDVAVGIRAAHSADWGSGTCEAKAVADLMALEEAHHTAHLGDVYYTGDPSEYKVNLMGQKLNDNQHGVLFPKGKLSTFLMNGNHEMVVGGHGLMKDGFTFSGQKHTFRAYMSAHWRVLHLDTGYDCYEKFGPTQIRRVIGIIPVKGGTDNAQPQDVIDWLVNVVKLGDPNDKRGIIITSHHQPYSEFEDGSLGTAKQLSKILPDNRTVIWFAGHEHRLALYDRHRLVDKKSNWTANFDIDFRMVGNGGFADDPKWPDDFRVNRIVAFDDRVYQYIPDDKGDANEPVGFNGYYTLNFDGPKVTATYKTGKCVDEGCLSGLSSTEGTTMATEAWTVDGEGGLKREWLGLGGGMTCRCGDTFVDCGKCPGLPPQRAEDAASGADEVQLVV